MRCSRGLTSICYGEIRDFIRSEGVVKLTDLLLDKVGYFLVQEAVFCKAKDHSGSTSPQLLALLNSVLQIATYVPSGLLGDHELAMDFSRGPQMSQWMEL